MQRYYGLNLDDLGARFSSFHFAACFVNLPAGAATLARMNPELRWDATTRKLHAIHESLCGVSIPKPWEDVARSSADAGNVLPELASVSVEEFMEWRKQEFKEVDECRIL